MFRSIRICLLLAVTTTAGCSQLPVSDVTGYCLIGAVPISSSAGCSELEGSGDCQPCPNARRVRSTVPTDRVPDEASLPALSDQI
jgi:hypothetical protein